jgi:hypothetical protein
MPFDPTTATASDFDEHIGALEVKLFKQLSDAEITRSRLKWFKDGRELFVSNDEDRSRGTLPIVPVADQPTEDGPHISRLRKLLDGSRPNLRTAIQIVMVEKLPRGGREYDWPAKEMIEAIGHEGWMPAGENAEHIVRNMLRDMTKRGQAERPVYGTYRLAPHMRVSLESGA